MDFNQIDKLSDEDLLEFYENSVVEGIYTGTCDCCRRLTEIGCAFGWNTGYCSLQLTTFDSCLRLCQSRGRTVYHFNSDCYCFTTGFAKSWYNCSN